MVAIPIVFPISLPTVGEKTLISSMGVGGNITRDVLTGSHFAGITYSFQILNFFLLQKNWFHKVTSLQSSITMIQCIRFFYTFYHIRDVPGRQGRPFRYSSAVETNQKGLWPEKYLYCTLISCCGADTPWRIMQTIFTYLGVIEVETVVIVEIAFDGI